MARLFSSLRRDERGLALTEFAFAAPIFISLVLVGLELSNLALAHLRVSMMAMTVADNAGRVSSGIDEANVYEVFAGAEVNASGLGFKPNGRIVLSSLEHNGKTGTEEGQTFIWLCAQPEELSQTARAVIDAPDSSLLLSDVTALEITLKWKAGKIDLPDPPRLWRRG